MGLGNIDSDTTSTVRGILHKTAEDLGDDGKDWFYGYGLTDALAAVNVVSGGGGGGGAESVAP